MRKEEVGACFQTLYEKKVSRDGAVEIATGYGLGGRGVGVRVPVRERFSLLHVVQTCSCAHPASQPMGTTGFLSGGKAGVKRG
jgi:hypothetical protein